MTYEGYKKFKFLYPWIKFYWNIFITLYIINGYICTVLAEVCNDSCKSAHIYYLILYRESLPAPIVTSTVLFDV